MKNEHFSNAANHTLSMVHNFGSCTVLQPQIPLALVHPSQAEFCDLDFTTDHIIPSRFHLRSLAYQPIDSDTKESNKNKSPAWKQKSEACMALIWCFHSLTVGASADNFANTNTRCANNTGKHQLVHKPSIDCDWKLVANDKMCWLTKISSICKLSSMFWAELVFQTCTRSNK